MTAAEVIDAQFIHTHLTTIHAAVEANQWDLPYEPVLDAIVAVRRASCVSSRPRIKVVRDAHDAYSQALITIGEWSGGAGYGLLVDVVYCCPMSDMVYNALMILNNYAARTTDNCRLLVGIGVIPLFVEALYEDNMDVVEQAGWGLGNIANDCVEFRDLVHQAGGVAAAVEAVISPLMNAAGRRNITWTMSNLCRGKPPPRIEQVAGLMEYFTEVLTKLTSAREAGEVEAEEKVEKETVDILWAISHLSEGDTTRVQIGINVLPLIVSVLSVPLAIEEPGYGDAPVVERQVPCEQMAYAMEYLPRADLERLCMLNSDIWNCCVCANRRLYNRVRSTVCHKREVRIPAVRIIGNVMTGSDDQTQAAIDCGALRVIEMVAASLRPLDGSSHRSASSEWKELCWMLSNVTAGTQEQTRLVLRSSVFYNLVVDALRATSFKEVRKEAAWVVSNALACIPNEVPLAWLALTFRPLVAVDADPDQLTDLLADAMRIRPQLPTSLSTISKCVTDDSTPENLLLLADTYTRDDCAGSATDKLSPLMRDHVLPVLYAAGKLDANPAFSTAVDGAKNEEALQDDVGVESADDEVVDV